MIKKFNELNEDNNIRRNIGGDMHNISKNLDTFYDLSDDIRGISYHTDSLNSGHDRDVVFAYIEGYLKEEKGIIVDIMEAISEEAEL